MIINYLVRAIDNIVVRITGWNHIPYSNANCIYINTYKYKGSLIVLSDGTKIDKGDWVAEIHLDNKAIKNIDTSYAGLIRLMKDEMKSLTRTLEGESYSHVKAVFGITVFHKIAQRQGFTVINIHSKTKRFLWSLWENILRIMLRKDNKKSRRKFVVSKECWISRSQIIEKFGS